MRGCTAICKLGPGTPCRTTIDVAPVSAIPCAGSMSMWKGLLARCASSCRGLVEAVRDKTLDVMTVTSSLMVNDISWVGFNGAETKSLNLFAICVASAPPCQKLPLLRPR